MIELVLIVIGVVVLALVVVFRKQINKYYDNMPGLSEGHAKFYKNMVVFLIPALLILSGIILLIVTKLDNETKQLLLSSMKSNYLNFILGVLMILFGIATAIIKLTDYKYKAFAKLAAMEERYGKTGGNIIHFFSYSIVPIAVGVYFLYRILPPL